MTQRAVISGGIVVNVIEADENFELPGKTLVNANGASIGWTWDGSAFAPPAPPPIASGQVDAERDRRTSDEFIFNGTAFQCDLNSQANITAKGSQAKFAVLAGATAGDLRWSDPNADFGWIATDNSIVPMDAQTMSDFADAADRWVTGHIMAAHAIKQMEPIPADYADDGRWP